MILNTVLLLMALLVSSWKMLHPKLLLSIFGQVMTMAFDLWISDFQKMPD